LATTTDVQVVLKNQRHDQYFICSISKSGVCVPEGDMDRIGMYFYSVVNTVFRFH